MEPHRTAPRRSEYSHSPPIDQSDENNSNDNPARFFRQWRTFGAVEPGLEADLILLDDNPLERSDATRRIHGVMLRGKWLSRQDLDTRLTALMREDPLK